MNVALKLAILRSGKRQWEVAREAGIHDTRLSKFVSGYGHLTHPEQQRLSAILGLSLEHLENMDAEATREG